MLFKRLKYYIYKIEYDENTLSIQYLFWWKNCKISICWQEIEILLMLYETSVNKTGGIIFRINENIIRQHVMLFDSYWKKKNTKELYEKLISLKKEYSTTSAISTNKTD